MIKKLKLCDSSEDFAIWCEHLDICTFDLLKEKGIQLLPEKMTEKELYFSLAGPFAVAVNHLKHFMNLEYNSIDREKCFNHLLEILVGGVLGSDYTVKIDIKKNDDLQ